MDELIKNVDVKEMGRRFKLVRQRLGLTQTEFYSRSVSLEGLLGKNFDIEDESLFSKDYAVATIVKAKLNAISEEYLGKLKEAENGFKEQMDAAIDLL